MQTVVGNATSPNIQLKTYLRVLPSSKPILYVIYDCQEGSDKNVLGMAYYKKSACDRRLSNRVISMFA